ncbi:MAG: FAD-dependent oxidoreductase [Candidatus Methylomirabilota bacterium]
MKPSGRRSASLRHVILGNSVAGIAAAQEIRRHDPEAGIVIVSDEPLHGYSRAMLPLYIAGKKRKGELVFAPRSFYAERRIRILRGAAEAVDASRRLVRLADGKHLPFDRLLVATGSASRTLDVPGKELPGIFPLRKFADAEAIKRHARIGRRVVIVGGGLVGVKSLEAMAARKKEIHLLISSDRILSQMLDRTASDLFLRAFERQGIRVHFQVDVAAFHGGERLEEVSLSDGTRLPCDLAIIGKGVDPCVACLQGTGVRLGQGVVVDEQMATSLPGIYAAGDVAEPLEVLQRKNLPSTIWPSAAEGGRVAGLNMTGVPATFSGALRMNSVEILGVRVISAGLREGPEQVALLDEARPSYRKLIFADGRLDGFLLLGDVRSAGVLTALVKNRTEVSRQALAADLRRGVSYRPRLYALGGVIQRHEFGGRGK